jgi:hypothetical protein
VPGGEAGSRREAEERHEWPPQEEPPLGRDEEPLGEQDDERKRHRRLVGKESPSIGEESPPGEEPPSPPLCGHPLQVGDKREEAEEEGQEFLAVGDVRNRLRLERVDQEEECPQQGVGKIRPQEMEEKGEEKAVQRVPGELLDPVAGRTLAEDGVVHNER